MTRNRTESAAPALGAASTNAAAAGDGSTPSKQLPSIRFIPHDDPRATRPSLQFPVISRTLPNEDSVIRVGRYSEKDTIPTDVPANVPSAAPVGFKSKVVSRRHCEFWCRDGQWWIKDVKSSSGTFLNHIRLSQPGVESKPFKVGDGDVVQLGIDFRGGEEMIFRCVKIRIECNRNWQKSLNNFNKSTHKTLRKLAQGTGKSKDSDAASTHSTDCSICLMSVRPCQALFVAPCSHVWHYKCISRVINGPTYPQFMCPNCRMVNDLDADVSEPED
ncbi:SMAD/FHA domain-containing protein, partial [Phyllosticta capitalensis]